MFAVDVDIGALVVEVVMLELVRAWCNRPFRKGV